MPSSTTHVRRRLSSLFIAAALAATPSPSLARPAEPTARELERFDKLYADAEKAFEAGRFEDAMRLYLSAFDTIPDPAVLFNIAYICERKLDNLELAEGYYERVAANRDAPPELISKAENRLAKVREAIRARKNGTQPTQNPPPKKEPPPDRAPEPASQTPDSALWPFVTMASGGVALLTGLALGGTALGVEDRLQAAESAREVARAERLRASGAGLAVGADILVVGGLLAAAGGAAWYLLGTAGAEPAGASGASVASRGARSWRIAPLVGNGAAGLTFGGSL